MQLTSIGGWASGKGDFRFVERVSGIVYWCPQCLVRLGHGFAVVEGPAEFSPVSSGSRGLAADKLRVAEGEHLVVPESSVVLIR